MKTVRVSMLALALFAAFAVQAMADDNWLIGTWATSAGLAYTFSATDVQIKSPDGKMPPFGNVKYEINGDTIVVSADGLPGKATFKMTDATHATLSMGPGTDPVPLTKQ
jgi:hypothetical protein